MSGEVCPVCDSRRVEGFLRRERVPVHQNIVAAAERAAVETPRGELDLAVCAACGFIFNRAFDPARMMYGEEYDNTQSCSPAFSRHMDDLVRRLVVGRGVRGARVVEVGCGRGLFLRKLVEFEGAGNTGHGFDPSYVGDEVTLGGRLRFERRYYDSECADVPADVVVCRHVIEHVPRPLALLGNVRKALANAPRARLFFETPCVEWILRNRVVWDFFYEHCSYFTAASLAVAFARAGFEVEGVSHVFGGQYLWLEARLPEGGARPEAPRDPGASARLAAEFARDERELVAGWRGRLRALRAAGGVALWGAGAKGVTFANLIDSGRGLVECVVDVNPAKQGCYVPGTGHPIVAPRDLPWRGVRTAVLMNPNYREENLRLLADAGLEVTLV
ncbi:MAG: class I SAM-dependent methyltransferase [Acidobacteria bacterium]|nr:class I SAM-dependent methyltransferase [Acidobacteriota bacterium]